MSRAGMEYPGGNGVTEASQHHPKKESCPNPLGLQPFTGGSVGHRISRFSEFLTIDYLSSSEYSSEADHAQRREEDYPYRLAECVD
jgi:hypothetical protein